MTKLVFIYISQNFFLCFVRHLEELYALERNKPLCMAHKLNERVLFPSSMEKMSVKLALSVFCESTRDALNL